MLVAIGPGHSAVTPTLVPSSSCSSASDSESTAYLLIDYGPWLVPRRFCVAATEAVLTTCPASPCFRIAGTKWRMPWMTPQTLTPMTKDQSATGTSTSRVPCIGTPALLQAMWSLPKRRSASPSASITDCSRVTSILTGRTCLLVPDRRCAACSTASFSMSAITTLAPASASAVAMPRPIPEAAPVTMAVLPEISMTHALPRRRGAVRCGAHARALPFMPATGGHHGKAPDVSAARQCLRPQRRAVEEVVRGSARPARLRIPAGLGRLPERRPRAVARGGVDAGGRGCALAGKGSGGPEPHGLAARKPRRSQGLLSEDQGRGTTDRAHHRPR